MANNVVKILSIEPVTHDVKRFLVEKPNGYSFTPGQATDVAINLDGWQDQTRPFTFTSLNQDPHLEFIIKEYPVEQYPKHRGMTEMLHSLKVGDELILGDPWGTINYQGPGVFIAGGAGITPFVAIFRHLSREEKLSGNRLFYSNKLVADIILETELRSLFPAQDLVLTLTRQESPGYQSGRISRDFIHQFSPELPRYFYICGPKPMVKDLSQVVSSMGVNSENLIFEK